MQHQLCYVLNQSQLLHFLLIKKNITIFSDWLNSCMALNTIMYSLRLFLNFLIF
jgi:hypothetical protein